MQQLVEGLLAIAGGVFGILALFYVANFLVERLPTTWEHRVKPWIFIAPSIAVVTVFLVGPGILTIRDSFYGPRGETYVGWENYVSNILRGDGFLGLNPDFVTLISNNLIWIVAVPTICIVTGLATSALADRLRPRWESIAKSTIFLPLAISFVGAATIWNFVYAFRAGSLEQVGLLNAVVTSLGFGPTAWLTVSTLKLNTILLTIVMGWMYAGFAMVLLSAAIKSVPEETLEAARIDGASELQIFRKVTLPQIRSTVFVVATTITVLVMKIFDIVFVMTSGRHGTDIVAHRFYTEAFQTRQQGDAAVFVVVLIVAVIPLMYANIQQFKEQEATR